MKKILAIDPGANGAMVWTDVFGNSNLFLSKLSSDPNDVVEIIKKAQYSDRCQESIAFVEDVGKHVSGNSATGSIALARNHQNIKTCLYMLGIETVDVSPQRWTKEIGVQVKDERSKEEKQRVRNLEKGEKNRENARIRRNKKAQKNEKIRALLEKDSRFNNGKRIPDYALDAYGIYLYAEKIVSKSVGDCL